LQIIFKLWAGQRAGQELTLQSVHTYIK